MNGVLALSCLHVLSRKGCGKHPAKERNGLTPEHV